MQENIRKTKTDTTDTVVIAGTLTVDKLQFFAKQGINPLYLKNPEHFLQEIMKRICAKIQMVSYVNQSFPEL